MSSRLPLAFALAAAALVCQTAAQAPDTPRFEVASVKRNLAEDGRVGISGGGGRFTVYGGTLKLLIRNAYQLQEFQIVGGPEWLDVDRYDVAATSPEEAGTSRAASDARQQLMLRSLLQDRFGLAVHTDTREMPVYALILARRDGKLGPQLKPVSVDCTGNNVGGRGTPPPASQRQPCSTSVGPGVVVLRGKTMAQFATALSTLGNTGSSLNRMIIDRTGLDGTYDVELRFTPDRIPNFGPNGPPPNMPPIDPNGPSIFTAVQEQLGLKLDAQRGPVEVLVIDKAARPTEN